MKKNILSAFTSIISVITFAQNNEGIGTNTPNASALIDVSSTTKGLLIPRMTVVKGSAITSPSTGLLVFDTDTKTIWAYDGVAWENLYGSGGGGSLSLPFFAISKYIGTRLSGRQPGAGCSTGRRFIK